MANTVLVYVQGVFYLYNFVTCIGYVSQGKYDEYRTQCSIRLQFAWEYWSKITIWLHFDVEPLQTHRVTQTIHNNCKPQEDEILVKYHNTDST